MDIAIGLLGLLVITVLWITLTTIAARVDDWSELLYFLVCVLGSGSSVVLYVLLLAKAGVIALTP